MIARGMTVQIRRSGAAVAIERLEIGGVIYDPLRDDYLEIVDILSRENALPGRALVRIGAGQRGPGRPRRNLLVSPQQPVAVTARPGASAMPELRFEPAWKIGTRMASPARLFVLVPERPCNACVEGVLLPLPDAAELFGALPGVRPCPQTRPGLSGKGA